eukprot:9024157-Karenia_brevis.AAC.1
MGWSYSAQVHWGGYAGTGSGVIHHRSQRDYDIGIFGRFEVPIDFDGDDHHRWQRGFRAVSYTHLTLPTICSV